MTTKVKTYSTLSLFLRSLLLSIILIVTSAIYCLLCILIFPLPLRIRYNFTMEWVAAMLWVMKVLCHINYKVEGREQVKKIKNGLLFSKHQSAWETFFLGNNFRGAAVIVKRELLWLPFFGWGLALLAPIAINRNNRKSAMAQIIQQGQKYLDQGRWVIVFPEGTRVAPGDSSHYRLGGARLAVATGYPIIPMAHNAGHCWPRRGFIKRPGTVQVVFGPPIYPAGKTAEQVQAEVKGWIENTMLRIEQKNKPINPM